MSTDEILPLTRMGWVITLVDYIGVHAAVAGMRLRYRSYFPTVDLIAPE
ncbi:MAG TPA: hypothetical protein VF713_10770 [Thermoanaerobaculia bacterium]